MTTQFLIIKQVCLNPLTTTFFLLLVKLRNAIYSLVLISCYSIKICSLLSKYLKDCKGYRQLRSRKEFGQLLLVNKQIYKKASYIFYLKNTFAIRSGPLSLTITPNLHRLKCFLQRVLKEHTSCITNLKLIFVLEQYYQDPLVNFFTNLKQ